MSIFSLLGFSPSVKYSKDKHQISTEQMKRLMGNLHQTDLSRDNEITVSETILAKRDGEDKISLQQIYEVLTKLKNENRITKLDRTAFMKIFEEFFIQHFK